MSWVPDWICTVVKGGGRKNQTAQGYAPCPREVLAADQVSAKVFAFAPFNPAFAWV
jgi:hypothetical protein